MIQPRCARGQSACRSVCLPLAATRPLRGAAADAACWASLRGFALAYNVRSPAEVDALLARAASYGATVVKPGQPTDWGGYSGYFTDPEGFLWEVAHNPGFPHV